MGKLRFLLQGVVFGTVKGRCQPLYSKAVFEHFIETTLRWDGKSFDRFTRVSSETLKNEEEEERGKKDYCQLVIEGIGVLTREIRLWRGGEEGAGVRMGRKKKTRSVIIDDR